MKALTRNRVKNSPKEKRMCDGCLKQYLPNSGHQRWCMICVPTKRAQHIIQRYGLSQPQWDELFLTQNGNCALCPNEIRDIDHDHETNEVRGLLCMACNVALGRLEKRKEFDILEWATKVVQYLKK
jgi:recombination endonuclease VII